MPYCDYLRLKLINESRRSRVLERIEVYTESGKLILARKISLNMKSKEEKEVDIPFTNELADYILKYGKIKIKVIDDRGVCSQKTYTPTEKEKEFIRLCA